MPRRFTQHYTPSEAAALLPQVGPWLAELRWIRDRLKRLDERLVVLLQEAGDQGGERVEDWVRHLDRLRLVQGEFLRREIQILDLERGQLGFPSLRGHHEVYLCWQEGEAGIQFWREIDGTGTTGLA